MSAPVLEGQNELVALGEGFGAATLILNPATGEIVGEVSSLPENATAEQIAAHVGPRLIASRARLVALNAEEEELLKPIKESFAVRRKREEDYITFLEMGAKYREVLRAFAKESLEGKDTRTLRIGFLKLSFKKNPNSFKVKDTAAAIKWARVACPDAINETTSVSVLVSLIPEAIKQQLLEGKVPSSGIEANKGVDVFNLEIEQPKAKSQGKDS